MATLPKQGTFPFQLLDVTTTSRSAVTILVTDRPRIVTVGDATRTSAAAVTRRRRNALHILGGPAWHDGGIGLVAMVTDDDAIPGLIEEDPEVSCDPVAPPGPAALEDRATRPSRLSAHERPTGQFSAEELERHTEVTTPGRKPRDTLELDVLAVEALTLLSKKDPEEVELLEKMLRESRRTPSR